MKKRGQKGGVVILALVAMSLFMLGAIGLAIDTSYLYSHRQMAQVAADSAAQAAIMSVFDHTNVDDGTCNNAFGSSAFSCTANSDCRTPCRFARYNGFGVGADDVFVEFPAKVDGVSILSKVDNPPVVRVTVTRAVQTWLTRMVGAAATSNVRVQATAAIVGDTAPVPLIVLHPYLQSSLTVGGSGIFKICGGPVRSIQVNSCAGSGSKIRVTTPSGNSIKDCGTGIPSTVFNGNRTVDLTKAGINDPGNCTTGTGADFGNFGLPLAPPPANISCCLGTAGRYVDPASPIQDPLIDVAPPAQPLASLTSPGGVQIGIPVPNGVYGCPSSPAAPCNLYLPGYYANGFQAKGETALMAPGVYYMGSQGFSNASNGVLQMAACPASGAAAPLPAQIDPDTDTGCGMLVFNTGTDGKAAFNLGSNSSASLTGSLDNGKYAGILFFQDRTVTSAFTHSLGGGGNMALLGTIYLVNNDKINYPQTLSLQGNSGSSTQVSGQIVIDLLSLGGGGSITMALGPGQRVTRKVALVR